MQKNSVKYSQFMLGWDFGCMFKRFNIVLIPSTDTFLHISLLILKLLSTIFPFFFPIHSKVLTLKNKLQYSHSVGFFYK